MVNRFIGEHNVKFHRRYEVHGYNLGTRTGAVCKVYPLVRERLMRDLFELENGKMVSVQLKTFSHNIYLMLDDIVYQTRINVFPENDDLKERMQTLNEAFTEYHEEHVKQYIGEF